jgi:hypothetical protein
MAEASPANRDQAFREARNLVRQSLHKEAGVLESVRRLAPRGRAAEHAREAASRLENELGASLAAIEDAFEAIAGKKPPNLDLDKEERAMAAKVFVPITDVAKIQDADDALRGAGSGLHSMMKFEVLNFADGRRNAYEVYEAVAAEALSAGKWYYGDVRPADVMSLLEKAAEAGLLSTKAAK